MRWAGISAIAQALFLTAPVLAGDTSVDRGLEIATTHCSRCHIVDEKNRFGGISSTPSFKTLVTALDDWHDRFATFYARNPHQSVIRIKGVTPSAEAPPTTAPVELTSDDTLAILSYAEEIARQFRGN